MKQNFCVLRKVTKTLNMLENELRDQFDLTLNECIILCLLWEKPYKAMDIAIHLGIATSRISRILASLDEKKMIARDTGARDKREIYMSLTTKAKTALEAIQASKIKLPVISITED